MILNDDELSLGAGKKSWIVDVNEKASIIRSNGFVVQPTIEIDIYF